MICKVLFFVIFIIEAYSLDNNYENKTFRCNDGKYIPGRNFCPNESIPLRYKPFSLSTPELRYIVRSDCKDGSHQTYGCDPQNCEHGQFKCNNGTCLNVDVRCNTIKDCSDGSDELNCGDEIQIENCTLANGKFLCYDKLRCLDLEYACNKECNCFDCSDENANCTTDYLTLSEELKDCPHRHFDTPNGPKCFCDPNDPKMDNLCKNVTPCEKWNPCDQKCYQYKSKTVCSCYDNNYVPVPADYSNFVCKSKVSYENLLVYTTSNQIKVINSSSSEKIFTKKKIQPGVIVGAGYHLYYTTYDDGDRKTIYKTSILNGMTNTLIESNSSVVSIAVDYITNNLYFTTNSSLFVCSNDGTICTQLKCCNVRYVALAPKSGFMFYMEKSKFQDERFIMKSAMDGSDEDYFVDGGFSNFSYLAVDESTRRLYWMQQEENEIWSLSYDDSYKEPSLIKYHGTLMAFSVFENELFFTKLRDNEIYRIRKVERFATVLKNSMNGRPYSFGLLYMEPAMGIAYDKREHISRALGLSGGFGGGFEGIPLEIIALSDNNATRLIDSNVTFAIKYVFAYNPVLQNFSRNPCAKASCDGLCLLRPPASKNDSPKYVCMSKDSITSKSQILSSPGIAPHRDNPVVAEMYTTARQNERSQINGAFILTIVGVVVFLLLALVGYLVFTRPSWSEYYSRLRNWRSNKSNEHVNICDQVEL